VKVTILGSGSRGNAILLTADGTSVLLDAGFPLRTLKRRAKSVDADLSRLAAVIVTHEHHDHACGAVRVAMAAKCPLYGSRGTLQRIGRMPEGGVRRVMLHLEKFAVGPFEITACRTVHDAVEPVALAVSGPDGERVVLAYDMGRTTPALRRLLRAADCLIVESNHDESMLNAGPYPLSVRRRIAGPEGHLSNRSAAQLLAEACHRNLETVVLAHVSEICNRKSLAQAVSREALARRGYGGRLFIAEQDWPLEGFHVGAANSSVQLPLL
jgi:phosphoribosyl 1,2-cyclic phosphodiesterase